MQRQLFSNLIEMRTLRTFALFVLLGFSWQSRSQYAAENLTPTEIIKEGLSLEQAPDGRIFIAERAGLVRVYQNGTVSTAFTVTTTTNNEQGLLGLTLHPDFATNGYVYVFYSIIDNGIVRHRIERVQVNAANQEVARTEILLLEPIGGGFHNGGDLKFFNGYLYITVGDSQNNQNSQNLDTYKGKILRITEDGLPAPGNPFYGSGSVQRQSIWVYGFRNPWRLVPNAVANKLFVLDVGTSWEEVNEISNPAIRNYGWGHPQGGDGIQTETTLFTNPIFTYATGSIGNALTNGVLYNPSVIRYPDLNNKFVIKDYVRAEIRQFDWTQQPNPPSTVVYTTPHQFALGMMVGNDGYIYYCSYGNNGDLIKLNYTQETAPTIVNQPVSLTVMETNPASFTVDVSGAGQIDYQWQFGGEDIAGANSATYTIPAVTMANAGNYTCVVTNAFGSVTSNTAVLTVTPFSNVPTVDIVLPLPTLTWNADDVINFSATATDIEDGNLPASAFSWSIDLFHEDIPGAGHSHPGASPQGVSSGTFVASNQGEKTPNVWYRFTVTVTDSNGLTATDFVDVHPNLINVTADSSPTGLTLELNQVTGVAPTSRQGVANANLQTLNAPTPQFVGNTRYDFDHWQHGGAANQLFQAPADNDITYTAIYTATDLSQAPYQGIVAQIPGVIEAENYDIGIGAYFDTDNGGDTAYRPGDTVGTEACSEGGFNIGWVAQNEWLSYTSNVNTAGNYTINVRIATNADNRVLHFEVDGVDVTGDVNIQNTGGFQAWQTAVIQNVSLTTGIHIIKLYFESANINVNKFEFVLSSSQNGAPIADFEASSQLVCIGSPVTFTSVSLGTIDSYEWNFGSDATPSSATGIGPHSVTYSTEGEKTITLTASNGFGSDSKSGTIQSNTCEETPQSPYGGTPKVIPGRVEIEEYDLDGEGIAYHDLSAGNNGNAFRQDDVDLQAASEGTFNVGWVQNGEWLEYTTFVSEHGDYNIHFRVSTPLNNGTLHLEQDGVDIPGPIAIPNTGGFQNWQTVSVNGLHLHEGLSEFRIVFESNDINVNYIDFEFALQAPVAAFTPSSVTPCVNGEVVFTSNATGDAESHVWNFGTDATPATATGIGPHTVVYSSVGQKTVSYTVSNDAGSDTETLSVTSTICGTPYYSKVVTAQCGVTLSAINTVIGAVYLVSPVNGYRFRVENTATGNVQTIDRVAPNFQLTALANYDYATTYSISIMVRVNGQWAGYYGESCLVSTPAILGSGGAASVTPSQCGIVLPAISTLIATTSLQAVTGYRFRITDTSTNEQQTLDRGVHWFALTMLQSYLYGRTYAIEVAVKTNGNFSNYGQPCMVTTPAVPTLANCGGVVSNANSAVATTSLNRVTSYRFSLTNAATSVTTIVDRPTHYFYFNNVPNYVAGAQYSVSVAVMTAGGWSDLGENCTITAPGATRNTSDANDAEPTLAFRAIAYPNPYTESFALDMDVEAGTVNVKIYDMLGKIVEEGEFAAAEIETRQFGKEFGSGVYTVIVTNDSSVKTLRVIKR
ncbi:MAG: carbohydrate-binding protein [Flavobacterium sp.]|uniref:PQQ-dependent sugar dehydrogenase n=1 Tax=Flavobacterium sp. TaxID=239 RepID=UPI0011FB0730|nr:PQQ-dependent sugar dehydrogenase [Flavobacterium sp.]RZJ66009.1 MAG: carbohydrate-binding protein [Flavobacterium sp.]